MVNDTEDVWKSILCFVETYGHNDFLGIKKILTKQTEIESDLKITGDDAHEFMAEFAQAFKVDMTSFDPCCYFEPEGFLYGFFTLFHSKKTKDCINQKKKKITLEMLEQAAKSGAWNSE